MAWGNVLDIPGVGYTIEYRTWVDPTWLTEGIIDPVVVAGGRFTVAGHAMSSADPAPWTHFRIRLTYPGMQVPVAVRIRVDQLSSSSYGDDYFLGRDIADNNRLNLYGAASGERESVHEDADEPLFLFQAGYNNGTLATSFIIEHTADAPFWLDFVHCTEEV